jgi:DNA-binding winged helix-turn-helix (wHTH) protein
MPSQRKETLRFGPFQLLLGNKALLRDGRPVSITPHALELLAVLASHASQTVSKDQLMRAVWPDTFVGRANLSVYAAIMRKPLADAGSPLQIENHPKRGFRLVGEVRAASLFSLHAALQFRAGPEWRLEHLPLWVASYAPIGVAGRAHL